jgi:ribonucleotide reductase alpha subunit
MDTEYNNIETTLALNMSLSEPGTMYVTKRTGEREEVSFDKITKRIKKLSTGLCINPMELAQTIISQIYDGISTMEIDELSAEVCAGRMTVHPDYCTLAKRIIISNHHKNTSPSFSEAIQMLWDNVDIHNKHTPIINEQLYAMTMENKAKINSVIDYDNDYNFDYFGFKTLERAYLLKINGKVIERPQHMIMRVCLGIHKDDIKEAIKSYKMISEGYFTHATPTLFNVGTQREQAFSCFLLQIQEDSIRGIYKTLTDCALISQCAGGIGIAAHKVRAKGTSIRGTGGVSNGIVPMLKNFNETARYVDQCLTYDTIVYTNNGPMKICDLVVGNTRVLNKNGELETVQNVLEHPYDGKILHITTEHALFKLKITPEHPILAIQNQTQPVNVQSLTAQLDKKLVNIEWVDAKQLTNNSLIGFKIPKIEIDDMDITADDCYFYGLMLGAGNLYKDSANSNIKLNETKQTTQIAFIKQYLNQYLTVYHLSEDDNKDNTVTISWAKNTRFVVKYSDVYNSTKDKRIHARWLYLPLTKAEYIIKGMIDSLDSEYSNKHNTDDLEFSTSSLELVEGLRLLLLRYGVLTSGYVNNPNTTSDATTMVYTLRIPKTEELQSLCGFESCNTISNVFRYHDLLFTRVNTIEEYDFTGSLYDLQMPTEHNYLTHNGLVHNGGGKRKGSIAIYLEPWHADIEDFLHLRRNTGAETERARDLFYAMWIPDLFMERVRDNKDWTLMCPDVCPGLHTTYGAEFKELYEKYEREGRGKKTIKAQKLWQTIIDSQIETGTPYIGYKDHINNKNNQKNLGVIQSSNLCVAGNTNLLTRKGYMAIQSLVNQEVEVWNGEEWSTTTVRKTGENQDMLKVSFSNGKSITCTPYHKFYITSSSDTNSSNEVRAGDLKPNDTLMAWRLPDTSTFDTVVKVVTVEALEEKMDTYCVNEPKRHKAMFNGILTGNCIEIVEYTSPEEHAVCCLLSVALPKYLEPVEVKGSVKVYSKTDCKYCVAAKNLLLRLGIKYEEINLDDDTKRKETITELNKKELECSEGVCKVEGGLITTVPQIYIDDKRIGGYKELLEALKPRYNFDKLREATKMAVRNLNKLIDYNYYPVPETETSNRRHRPIGIGVQGLADTFLQLRMAFDSDEAIEMSRKIAETMYLAACQASMDIARKRKKYVQDYRRLLKKKEQTPLEFTPEDKDKLVELETKYFIYKDEVEKLPMSLAGAYSSFVGSPASEGKLQFDLWGVKPSPELEEEWAQLKDDIKKHGLRNSLLMASMPTASTSQILGNNECFEPYTNNIYTRQTLAGIFTIVNKYLIQDCIDLGIWTAELKDKIILANGSVQHIEEIPKFVRDLYKVVWEIKQKWLVDHAVARAPFICQTQSMNIFMKDPTPNKLNKLHFYAWNKGLKTGIYYLRTLAKSQSSKFSVDMGKYNNNNKGKKESGAVIMEELEDCLSCSA